MIKVDTLIKLLKKNNGINLLRLGNNLIKIDGKRGMMLSSTPLGKYILNTEYNV